MTELNFVNDYQLMTLLSASASDLPDIWKNQFEGKQISFSGHNVRKVEDKIILTRIVLYISGYYADDEDESSFIDGIEFIVNDPSGKYYGNHIVEIFGTLRSYEKIVNDDNQTGDKSVIRIQVESSSITQGVNGWGFTM
jgi:hypothetical protein